MLTIPAQSLTPIEIFLKLYNGYGSFILESPNGTGKLERYSFIGVSPKKVIHSFDELTQANLHFGAFGFLSYDFGREIEEIPNRAEDDLMLPRVWFVLPQTLVVFDHAKKLIHIKAKDPRQIRYRIESNTYAPLLFNDWQRDSKFTHNQLIPYIHRSDFIKMVNKAKEYIAAGDIYQVNLSQRFNTPAQEHPLLTYLRLRKINPSPFASYFDCGPLHLAGCSPERLIKLKRDYAETRPIAGTKPINSNPTELLIDLKERAEHIMMVDLERNDLGKVCEYGSVKADEMMTVEKYSHVYHIVSNVRGKLRDDKDKFDLIRAMFPGGTITGCPKVGAMEIIEELEPVKRGPYTGSIGYIMHNRIDFNIAIRTIVFKDRHAYIQVGAGIVADSDPEREYEETIHKALALFEALKIKKEAPPPPPKPKKIRHTAPVLKDQLTFNFQ